MAMCALSRSSPATGTCAPSAAIATTDTTSPTKFHVLSPKSEAGCLLTLELCHPASISISCPDGINPPVGQRRRSGGFGAGLGKDAVNRALADLEGGSNLGPGAAGCSQLDHLRCFGASVWWLSLVLALGLGAGDPFALALEHDLALELGHCRHDGEDHAAHRAGHAAVRMTRWLDRHRRVEDLQGHAALAELLGEGQRVACRARQAIETGHDQHVPGAQDAPAQQVEFGPLADAGYLFGVDVALGAAGCDQVADLGLQPGFLVTG